MAGYSSTPLVKKLGVKPGHRLALLDPPGDFHATLGDVPEGVSVAAGLDGEDPFDVIVCFVTDQSELLRRLAMLTNRLAPAGGLWVAWPKRASGVATDLTETVVRARGLATGLVDNKVCAIDDTWAGLRFVIRLRDRPKSSRRTTAR